ncbi:MAG: hypothetical protein ACRBI6_22130 [Acidimicrobiales bacterium]
MAPRLPTITGHVWPFTSTEPVDVVPAPGRVTVVTFVTAFDESCAAMLRRVGDAVAAFESSGLAGSSTGTTVPVDLVAVHSPRYRYARNPAIAAEWFERVVARTEGVAVRPVHDPDHLTWARLGPNGWPTTLVVDHRGRVRGAGLGRPGGDAALDALVDVLDAARRAARADRRSPLTDGGRHLGRRRDDRRSTADLPAMSRPATFHTRASRSLRRPTGVAIDGSRIVIADNGNDRLLVGRLDRDPARVEIEQDIDVPDPRKVAIVGGLVACTSPSSGRVVGIQLDPEAVGGTGAPATLAQGLVWPLGVTADRDGSIAVTDAGADQLLRISFPDEERPDAAAADAVGIIGGSGRTGLTDGRAGSAELCQPTAVTRVDKGLVFCDSGTGALRFLDDRGHVATLTATPPLEPGLVDGPVHRALFQHPGDVASDGDTLWVADRGNRRLRSIVDRKVVTVEVPGLSSCEAVTPIGDGRLVIVDTAANRLVVVDPTTGEARPLEIVMERDRPPVGTSAPPRSGRR